MAKKRREEWTDFMEKAPDGYVLACDHPGFRRSTGTRLYESDFFGDREVAGLDVETKGVYALLLLREGPAGSLPSNGANICRCLGISSRKLRRMFRDSLGRFFVVSGDRVINRGAEKRRKKRQLPPPPLTLTLDVTRVVDEPRADGAEAKRTSTTSMGNNSHPPIPANSGRPPPTSADREADPVELRIVGQLVNHFGFSWPNAWALYGQHRYTEGDLAAWVAELKAAKAPGAVVNQLKTQRTPQRLLDQQAAAERRRRARAEREASPEPPASDDEVGALLRQARGKLKRNSG